VSAAACVWVGESGLVNPSPRPAGDHGGAHRLGALAGAAEQPAVQLRLQLPARVRRGQDHAQGAAGRQPVHRCAPPCGCCAGGCGCGCGWRLRPGCCRRGQAAWPTAAPTAVRSPAPAGDILSIAAGPGHVFASTVDGSIHSWIVPKNGNVGETLEQRAAHTGRVSEVRGAAPQAACQGSSARSKRGRWGIGGDPGGGVSRAGAVLARLAGSAADLTAAADRPVTPSPLPQVLYHEGLLYSVSYDGSIKVRRGAAAQPGPQRAAAAAPGPGPRALHLLLRPLSSCPQLPALGHPAARRSSRAPPRPAAPS
jgi:hypothetical protein